MLRHFTRNAAIILLFFIIASCSGGGCSSGCSSCGITPLPAGFPNASAVTNAASVRVTRPGLDFLQANIGALAGKLLGGSGGVINFNIPTSMQSVSIITLTVCPNGPSTTTNPPSCIADINIGGAMLTLDAITADSIKISGTIPIKLQDLPITTSLGSLDIGVGTGDCSGPGGLPNMDYIAIPVDIELPLVADTIAPRTGYTKIDAANAVVNVTITSDDVQICNGGFIGFILDLFKSTVVSDFVAPLVSTLKNTIGNELCTKPDLTTTPVCPDGSQPDNADPTMATNCVYTAMPNTCMPILIGTDGHMNLGSLLSSISPGTTGGLDFLLASNGNMNPAPGVAEDTNGHTTNGMTLGFLGGTLPQPQTSCVPIAPNPIPTNIPIPMQMMQDTVAPWPMGDNGPDLGVALAGRFLDFALVSVYNSGLLCLGVSTEQEQVLSSGLLSLLVPSFNKLTWEARPAAAAITTRPQAPPTLSLGGGTNVNTDPLLKVVLPQFAIDFYVWSDDRFVRTLTFTSDITVPINLSTAVSATNPNGGIVINLGTLVIANGAVTNNELITDDPTKTAGALAGILSAFAGQLLGGGIAPINLSSALSSFGLAMTIPAQGIKKISQGTDDYLAIFADLTLAAATPLVHTGVGITGLTVHPEAMSLTTFEPEKAPSMTIALSSPADDGTQAVEYSWWIDTMARSPWSSERNQTIAPQYMLLQGKHTLHAVARLKDQPGTEDLTAATVPYIVDVLAPNVTVSSDATNGVSLDAWDIVSDESAMLGRYRLTSAEGVVGNWTEWQPLADIVHPATGNASSMDAQVKDEAGNVGSTTVALIRGRPDPTLATGSGCGSCSTLGSSPDAAHAWAASLAILVGLVAFASRRRRGLPVNKRASIAALGVVGALSATNQGCSCGSSPSAAPPMTGCGMDCNQPCGPANNPGLIGSYTSIATASDGTIWVSGYNDGDVSDPHGSLLWGDLAVGKFDSGKQLVQWVDVDGLPAPRTDGTCPPNDPTGWHGGESDLGPDVGQWSSIVLGADQNPMVSYYDATNHALKFAFYDGTNWASYTVLTADQSDIGRYSKIVMRNGNPAIAYLSMEPGTAGGVKSKVALATASSPLPKDPTAWTFSDIAVDPTDGPCAAMFCDPGALCIKETGVCQATVSGCTPAGCMSSSSGGLGSSTMACVMIATKPTCGTVEDKNFVDDYPDGYGDYVSVANGPQGLGILLYDRIHGNLVGVQESGSTWKAAILDGETGSRTPGSGADGGISAVDTGDTGVGASLFIAPSGDWHVSYVNGLTEALQYAFLPMGKFPAAGMDVTPEIVDVGLLLDNVAFSDGQHIVGDDSDLSVDSNGVVTILYQDATVGKLRVATGAPSMGVHKWTVKAETQPNLFAGYFPRFVPATALVSNWWRSNDTSGNTTGNVSLLTP